jgi:hypothetical protein
MRTIRNIQKYTMGRMQSFSVLKKMVHIELYIFKGIHGRISTVRVGLTYPSGTMQRYTDSGVCDE